MRLFHYSGSSDYDATLGPSRLFGVLYLRTLRDPFENVTLTGVAVPFF